MKTILSLLMLAIFSINLGSCASGTAIYVKNDIYDSNLSKEKIAISLIKECKVSPDIKFTELDNRYELTQVYLRNCKPETSPNAAIYVGINPYYRR